MIVSTAAIWAQARKTEIANNSLQDANHKHNVYIIETWPLLDGFAMERMGQATKMMSGQADPAIREEFMETYRQALNFYRHASELPPADLESRAIIAKAHNRLGLTNAMLSTAKGGKNGPDPSLLSQSEADYRRSLVLFEAIACRVSRRSQGPTILCRGAGILGLGLAAHGIRTQGRGQAALRARGAALARADS